MTSLTKVIWITAISMVFVDASTVCTMESGYCVKSNGDDQNSGVIKLSSVNLYTAALRSWCLEKCLTYSSATGCEGIWTQSNRGCYVHTQSVDHGNGNALHVCWIFSKCTEEDDPTNSPTMPPTGAPTNIPTVVPTEAPTNIPTVCGPYINDVEDMVFKGIGSDCRSGMDSSWPGGLTCGSPYIICLPQENTLAADGFGSVPYKSNDHRYTVEECLQECANDLRCLGAEFVADTTSSGGDCNLIDVIPPAISSEVLSNFTYDSGTNYTTLDSNMTGGNALCFEKEAECYPYWEASDLSSVMLNCYCPNNRKGFYTKKVHRTLNSTRYCGNDTEVDERIQKAQANRMFHLCENWCLFETENPESEAWYYDPWKSCWREQLAGVGNHWSYCNRVIRSPDSIEMQFVNYRSNSFCRSDAPTKAPSTLDSVWLLADKWDSCDDACTANGTVCDENLIGTVVNGEPAAESYFNEAGVTCTSIEDGEVDWAFPAYHLNSGICYTRDNATENTGCNWAIGKKYVRLCACA